MKDITLELLIEKLLGKLTSSEFEDFKNGKSNERVKEVINEAMNELEKEVDVALSITERIVDTAESKINGLKIFWYAVLASFFINILSTIILTFVTGNMKFLSTLFGVAAVSLLCLIALGFIFVGMAGEVVKFWEDATSKNKIIAAVVKKYKRGLKK